MKRVAGKNKREWESDLVINSSSLGYNVVHNIYIHLQKHRKWLISVEMLCPKRNQVQSKFF